MPMRRDSSSPQTAEAVFLEEIIKLKQEVQRLKQTGPSSLQPDDYEDGVDPAPWEVLMHWPHTNEDGITSSRQAEAVPWDTAVYWHPGYIHPDTEEETFAGWKALSSYSVYAHKIYSDKKNNKVDSPARVFYVHPRHDRAKVRQVIGWNGIPAGTNTIEIVNMTRGIDLLSSPLSFTDYELGEINLGGDPSDPNNKVYAYDVIHINVTAASGKGLGVYIDIA